MKKSNLQNIVKEELYKVLEGDELSDKLKSKIETAFTDGPPQYQKQVEVKVLEEIPLKKDFTPGDKLWWVEYPKGYLDLMYYDSEAGIHTVDHDVPMDEILEGIVSNPEQEIPNKAKQFNLKFPKRLSESDELSDKLKSKMGTEFSGNYSKNQPKTPEGTENLPDTKDKVDWSNKGKGIELPSLDKAGVNDIFYSKEDIKNWIKNFKQKFGEYPKFENKDGKTLVTNPKFVEFHQNTPGKKPDWWDRKKKIKN